MWLHKVSNDPKVEVQVHLRLSTCWWSNKYNYNAPCMEESTAEGAVELGWCHLLFLVLDIMYSIEVDAGSASVAGSVDGHLASPRVC